MIKQKKENLNSNSKESIKKNDDLNSSESELTESDQKNSNSKKVKKTNPNKGKKKEQLSNQWNNFKKSLGNKVDVVDSKINPKIGKGLNIFFKWLTLSIFIIGIPSFVIFYQFANTVDAYTFNVNYIEVLQNGGYKESVHSVQVEYTDIDNSIDELFYYNNGTLASLPEDNLFTKTLSYDDTDDSKVINIANAIINPYDFTQQTWIDSVTDQITFVQYVDYLESGKAPTFPDGSITNNIDAKNATREAFPPQGKRKEGDQVKSNGMIIGWVLVALDIISGIMWYYFSKWSNVKLIVKKDKKSKKQEGSK